MRTQSTRKAAGTLTSPEMYIRLTSLEMERARRVMERDRLLQRIVLLDERILKIAEEQLDMRQRIDFNGHPDVPPPLSSLRGSQPAAGNHDNSRGLTY